MLYVDGVQARRRLEPQACRRAAVVREGRRPVAARRPLRASPSSPSTRPGTARGPSTPGRCGSGTSSSTPAPCARRPAARSRPRLDGRAPRRVAPRRADAGSATAPVLPDPGSEDARGATCSSSPRTVTRPADGGRRGAAVTRRRWIVVALAVRASCSRRRPSSAGWWYHEQTTAKEVRRILHRRVRARARSRRRSRARRRSSRRCPGRPTATTTSGRTSRPSTTGRRTAGSGMLRARWFVEFPPAVGYGKVFVSQLKGVFFAVDAKTGEWRWRRKFPLCSAASPALARRPRDRDLHPAALHARARAACPGLVIAMRQSDGRTVWRVPDPVGVLAARRRRPRLRRLLGPPDLRARPRHREDRSGRRGSTARSTARQPTRAARSSSATTAAR